MGNLIQNLLFRYRERLLRQVNRVLLGLSTLTALIWLAEFGFYIPLEAERAFTGTLEVFYVLFGVANLLRLVAVYRNRWRFAMNLLTLLVAAGFQFVRQVPGLALFEGLDLTQMGHILLLDLPLLTFIAYELAVSELRVYQLRLNPSAVFLLSFLMLILAGSLLLMLPKATTSGITYLDALFTATSAVCVTGLIVVDTATAFTLMGKIIIIVLVQLGGLGIITFTYFFGYFFQGSASFQSTIYMNNMFSTENVGSTVRIILRIVLITFGLEAAGGVLIWLSMGDALLNSPLERVGFSAFHAISAVCNAGFSTLSNGLFDEGIRFNYELQLVVILLIILGGIGFPSLMSLGNLLRFHFRGLWVRLRGDSLGHIPRLVNLNAVLALNMTAVLLVAGVAGFLLFEQDGILAGHDSLYGKAVTAFFAAVTPRTAGFNTVDLSQLAVPSLIITLGLMWVGASPNSTGGGIKTTTFAVALLNILSIARGKDRLEISRREISQDTVYKAFAIMLLSVLLIIVATTALTYTEPGISPYRLIFEVFSAVGTVGLSLGVTGKLSAAGKLIITLCMFIGRVGALTLITALIRKVVSLRYSYPREELKVG